MVNDAGQSPTEKETALRLYGYTVSQYIERIKLRESAVRSFVVAAGVIGGWVSGEVDKRAAILLLIPILAGATAFLSAYNSLLVDATLSYCADVLYDKIGPLPTFDQHSAFVSTGMMAVKFRVVGYFIVLLAPSIVSLYEVATKGPDLPGVSALWWISLAIVVCGAMALFYSDIIYHAGQVRLRATIRPDGETR